MAVTYTCDICDKKAKEVIIVMAGSYGKSPYRHLCSKCWDSTIKFLAKRVKFKNG